MFKRSTEGIWTFFKLITSFGFLLVATRILLLNHNFDNSSTSDYIFRLAVIVISPKLVFDFLISSTENHIEEHRESIKQELSKFQKNKNQIKAKGEKNTEEKRDQITGNEQSDIKSSEVDNGLCNDFCIRLDTFCLCGRKHIEEDCCCYRKDYKLIETIDMDECKKYDKPPSACICPIPVVYCCCNCNCKIYNENTDSSEDENIDSSENENTDSSEDERENEHPV